MWRRQSFLHAAGLGKTAPIEAVGDQLGEISLAAFVIGQAEQVDQATAGVAARLGGRERGPGRDILRAQKQAVAINRTCQRLRREAPGIDDVVVVDAMDTHAIIATTRRVLPQAPPDTQSPRRTASPWSATVTVVMCNVFTASHRSDSPTPEMQICIALMNHFLALGTVDIVCVGL